MDFTFYKNFIIIAETGNLTLAAKRLSLAQPALSAQLRQLEAYYGVKLVETKRGKRSITLTEAGTDFLLKAQQLCHNEENLLWEMQSFQKKNTGTLHISISPAAVNTFMEKYLLPFAEQYPGISYVLQEEAVQEQLQNIRNGSSDFAYANAPLPDMQKLSCKQLRTECFFAVFRKDMPFKDKAFPRKAAISIQELRTYPLSCNQGCYGLLRQLCEKHGFTPEIKLLSTTGTAAARFALAGQLLAIVSDDCSRELPVLLQRIPIQDNDFKFMQTIFWSSEKELSPAAKSFLDFLEVIRA